MSNLDELVTISRLYGADPDYIIAGGGNTSYKDGANLWVKASGSSLGTINAQGFAAMDRKKLAAVWNVSGENAAERERAVLAGMTAARLPGEEQKRPSVETLLHDLLPFAYVVHTHPAMVNAMTCSQDGEAAMKALFGAGQNIPENAPGGAANPLWIPISDPGFVLALAVRDKLEERKRSGGGIPGVIFLQNHGIFAGADDPGGIKAVYAYIMDILKRAVHKNGPAGRPDFSAAPMNGGEEKQSACAAALLEKLAGGKAVFARNREILRLVQSPAAFGPVSRPFTPDHIVYSGSDPLFIEAGADTEKAWQEHAGRTGRPPKITALMGLGIFGTGETEKKAALALELFFDTMKIAACSEAFGGPRFMTEEKTAFINTWEAEQYRAKAV